LKGKNEKNEKMKKKKANKMDHDIKQFAKAAFEEFIFGIVFLIARVS